MKKISATYRLQFNYDFTFKDAEKITSYLRDVGISEIYASPVFQAAAKSMHGYDVVNHNAINREIGTYEDLKRLITKARIAKIGWIQDIVPNHMAFNGANPWICDIMEKGSHSPYWNFFDIDWDHYDETYKGKVLAPFLGGPYHEALKNKLLKLKYDGNSFKISYYNFELPLAIKTYPLILHELHARMDWARKDTRFLKLPGIIYSFKNLENASSKEYLEQADFLKSALNDMLATDKNLRTQLSALIQELNETKPFFIARLLDAQHFRLCHWKVAAEEINYRRFFNINELISLNVQVRGVFRASHALTLKMFNELKMTGLRVDHIDGLYDPLDYLNRLRSKLKDSHVFVEKILDFEEHLPESWPIEGTTGYEYMNFVNNLFCKQENESQFTDIYKRISGEHRDFFKVLDEKKRIIIDRYMAGDVERLAYLLKKICGADLKGHDLTLVAVKRMIVEFLAYFPVYRTYIDLDKIYPTDVDVVNFTHKLVVKRRPDLKFEVDVMKDMLLFHQKGLSLDRKKWVFEFVSRFQQLTGPMMAKGLEDTTLYCYHRFDSLNEVGGSPDKFGITPEYFHRFNHQRLKNWPSTMNASATHDTKRGEDVRARLNVLSEMPEDWAELVSQWQLNNQKYREDQGERVSPSGQDEYLLYQTLVGSLPMTLELEGTYEDRIKNYIIKAVREAKVFTEWLKPDEKYEQGCCRFIEKILKDKFFIGSLKKFVERIRPFGIVNSLAQTTLKMASPGIPDFYQGCELWDLSLVDPDNRRPVDYKFRINLLKKVKGMTRKSIYQMVADERECAKSGIIKLLLIERFLQLSLIHI